MQSGLEGLDFEKYSYLKPPKEGKRGQGQGLS